MKKYILSILLVAFISINLSAQVITRKTSINNIKKISNFIDKVSIDIQNMPNVDVNKVLLEDEKRKEVDGVDRFGYAFDVNYDLENSGTWIDVDSGRVWALEIRCRKAYSINLAFNDFFLPPKSKLYIYNKEKRVLQGP